MLNKFCKASVRLGPSDLMGPRADGRTGINRARALDKSSLGLGAKFGHKIVQLMQYIFVSKTECFYLRLVNDQMVMVILRTGTAKYAQAGPPQRVVHIQ